MVSACGNLAFFRADDGVNGVELWLSDGTEAGTVMVSDLCPGCSSYPFSPVEYNGELLFAAGDGTTASSCGRPTGPSAARLWSPTSVPAPAMPFPATSGSRAACSTSRRKGRRPESSCGRAMVPARARSWRATSCREPTAPTRTSCARRSAPSSRPSPPTTSRRSARPGGRL